MMVKMATNTRSVRKDDEANVIKTPIPCLAPSHSEITAPITLYVAETLKPEKIEGQENGSSNFQKSCVLDAPAILI